MEGGLNIHLASKKASACVSGCVLVGAKTLTRALYIVAGILLFLLHPEQPRKVELLIRLKARGTDMTLGLGLLGIGKGKRVWDKSHITASLARASAASWTGNLSSSIAPAPL